MNARHTAADARLHLSGLTRDIALDVLLDGPISRADLARRHSLTPGTVTRLVDPLLKAGLLSQDDVPGTEAGKLGRPSKPLRFVADNLHFVGLKLAADTISGALVDISATVLRTSQVTLRTHDVASVTDEIEKLVRGLAGGTSPQGVGIGLGGNVQLDGTLQRAPFLGWQNVPLASLVSRRLDGVLTVLTNDVAGLTETEHWFGIGHGLASFAVITLGAGIGYGLVSHGRLVQSPDYGIGLIGHLPLDPAGPRCPSGHIGCATALLTDSSIASNVSAGLGRPVTFDQALDLALDGDPLAASVIAASGRALGRLIGLVANLAMPQRIIVTGEAVRLATVAARDVAEGIRRTREPLADEVDYVVLPVEATDWARGAAVVAIQRCLLG